ncbi:putative nucleotide-binding alpha-beta plait domain-containing protein [Rosa chinensis]|uniref:Putative nucleotide-binding alpha-beta plait domain-containing protein n=1 Tax=Rosa chinensis TaxID=74649 RepID=A0A2P6RP70_ROSCH|nr:putative nucleotide-binding alpha-beta plait domain-containing protein [Rosa chinensis]
MEAEQERKLFVGGIPWQVDKTILEEHFSQYGEVEECVIVLDRITRQPRGFGFVTFTDQLVAEKVLEENHSIFDKKLVVNPSEPRRGTNQNNQSDQHAQRRGSYHPKKIFVGGLPHHLTEEEFINYFAKFGAIDQGVIMYEKETNTSRGFGFITFESDETVKDVMQKSFHELKNEIVEVRQARLEVRRNHRRLVNWYDPENVGSELVGGLRYDDLAFGVDRLLCYNCGGPYGYGHYPGCLYGEDPYRGTWNTVRVLHTNWVGGGEVDPWAWNGYLQLI